MSETTTRCEICGHDAHGECCDACNGSRYTGPNQPCQWCNVMWLTVDEYRSLTERAERAEAAHDNQVEQYLHLHDATKADAALGAALRAAVATADLYDWLAMQRLPDELPHRNVIVIPNRPEPHCEENDATRALAALLRSSASTERTT